MPRRPRIATGGYVYHVLNRAVGRQRLFKKAGDYAAFEKVLTEAQDWVDMRLLSYCLMPNHWHLVLWPRGDNDLSEYMRWLTNTHTRRWHLAHGTAGTGPIYQGRFKSFPVEDDEHYYSVCRYVERNAVRANLAATAAEWQWGSAWLRANRSLAVPLADWPLPRGKKWDEYVNQAATEAELESLRRSAWTGTPYGNAEWMERTAKRLGLESTLRRPGRPRAGGRAT